MDDNHVVETEENDEIIVDAPPPFPAMIQNGVLSVILEPDEEIEWIWSHYPDGRSVVTGYQLFEKEVEAENDT